MNRQGLFKLLAVFLTLSLLLLAFSLFAGADFGDFGGGNDYGGGDWGGSSDWGSSDFSFSGSGDGIGGGYIIIAIICAIAGYICIIAAKSGEKTNTLLMIIGIILMIAGSFVSVIVLIAVSRSKHSGSTDKGPYEASNASARDIAAEYISKTGDTAFDRNALLEKMTNLFIRMSNLTGGGDPEQIKPFFTETGYGYAVRMLDAEKDVVYSNPTVLRASLTDFTQNSTTGLDYITLKLDTRYRRGQKGSVPGESFMTYVFTVSRKTGEKTVSGADGVKQTCPYCGAPVNSGYSTVCEYCGSVLNNTGTDWRVESFTYSETVCFSTDGHRSGRPVDSYTSIDPGFDKTAFCNSLRGLYLLMQKSWSARDISPVRPYFTDTYFAQMQRQMQGYIDRNQTPHVEDINITSVEPLFFNQNGDNDVITVRIKASVVLYTTDDRTGAVVANSKNEVKNMTYEWDLIRKHGVTTGVDSGAKTVICPGCGAAVEINASMKCPYCGNQLTSAATDWAISAIRGISQVTTQR